MRSKNYFTTTLMCGAIVLLMILLAHAFGMRTDIVAAASGVASALCSIKFYEAMTLRIVSSARSPFELATAISLKLVSLGVLFILVYRGNMQTIICASLGVLCLVPAALLVKSE